MSMNEGIAVVTKVVPSVKRAKDPAAVLTREDLDAGPISLDEIEPGLWLGNASAAADVGTLKAHAIQSILSIDSVPLPVHITDHPNLRVRHIQAADVPREDLIRHFEDTNRFIGDSLAEGRHVLVHCYFGVSRSATIVIAYLMEKYRLGYEAAFQRVKAKRRFVMPNPGFVNQLKLYARMAYRIDRTNERYKLFRLRLAGDNVRKAKRLPTECMDVVKADPGVTQESPEPYVYRCRKCRRVVATRSNLLLHKPKAAMVAQSPAKVGREPEATLEEVGTDEAVDSNGAEGAAENSMPSDSPAAGMNDLTEQLRRSSISSEHSNRSSEKDTAMCSKIFFIEPLAWMTDIYRNTQGRLYCPKCTVKLGSFNWVMATKCPCGAEIFPAFYLVPSKTEYSTVVQNVQVTV
ncbi:dual specificity protein phosphatase MPK-4 [Anopheles ziemanni]|uniref:dual specificity protein phosphatase MPK-4 n=1 Tax=Anopheles coustani TaxID=139045 RepID=UPI0026596039|nr:dual specificity protein phosphatase MPK-4 [Anopheles coustani]XP_058172453.1 dual specificity protein phosphatase MPK-4 [Anopheles ziemanni]